jgi:hypothetical protein
VGGLAALTMGCLIVPAIAKAPPAPADDHALAETLRRQTQTLLDAIAPGDVKVWDHLLAPESIQVDENDKVRDRAQILADLKPLAPGKTGNLHLEDFRMVHHGDLAVVTHEDAEYLNYFGHILHSRFRMTDTWRLTPAGWRLVASQVLAGQQDPPAVALPQDRLCVYEGRYELRADIVADIHCTGDGLLVKRDGKPSRTFRPETADVSFEPGQPRSRRIFLTDAAGAVTGFVDRREGRDIAWRRIGELTTGPKWIRSQSNGF